QARKAAGYTQESFAEALGVDRSTVVRWEAADHEPSPYLWPKIARLLSVSRDELIELLRLPPSVPGGDMVPTVGSGEPSDHVASPGGLLLPVVIDGHPTFLRLDTGTLVEGRGRLMSPQQDDGGQSGASADETLHYAGRLDSTLHTVVELSGEDVKRREFLPGVAFAAAAFAEPALFALTAPPVADAARDAGGRRIGMTDVEILTDNVAHLRRMDFRYGSGRIRDRSVQLLHHAATTLLRGSYSDSTGRVLLTAVAQSARLAALMAVDVGRHALAQRYHIQALNLAMNAGNRLFAAKILCNMSELTILNATGACCARHAVALARAGITVAGTAAPTLTAQLSAAEARGHALGQDSNASRAAVLEAELHYERFRPDGEPAWLSFYTDAELAADLGRALRDSGEPAPAIGLMTRTLDNYEPWRVRSRCLVQTDLAAAYLLDGDYEHAAALTRDALNTAGKVSSSRTVHRIQSLQQQIRPLHSVGLADLDEEITGFLRRTHDDEDITT
ncbi:MAG: helix-turn-helix transcriptional regulator, partial [Pseudonocardiaceae bacterium]